MLAKIEPEILCQTLKMAPGRGCQRIGGEICRSQGDGQAAVLHTHFDGDRRGFVILHFEELCRQQAQTHAQQIVQHHNDPTKYEKGTLDENYYCEIWIPVKKKQ